MSKRSDLMIRHGLAQRDTIRFYNDMAARFPRRAEEYKANAKRALRRAVLYFDWAKAEENREVAK